ncbi:hypothetical protein K503DRAFT_858871 [Rhizopogon vinicolor AM-OR11-026]|uniref:Histone H1 n=1 Tax=Rhizopogon vinicolor AM-OR11-026 TaxID=1314800 RepID=A0A1B7MQV4_9AGAM|nr:hypothetical protein K503DRAFT_858871 [Rhizopogon vinicolor AM-OR11-026]
MVTTSTPKKSSTKAADASAKSAQKTAASKTYHTTHPSWIDMITECITTTPDGTRHGVSRPAIKKFVDSKYHLEINPLASSQLNRAIHQGADKGRFVLPKGPSGKVKLAPRRHNEAAKENTKPASKRSAAKESQAAPVKAASKTAAKKSRAAKPVTTTQPSASLKSRTEKKYHSTAKKAKATGTSTRKTAGRKATTARSTAKKTATGRTTTAKTKRGAAPTKRTTRAAASKQQRGKRISRK